MITQSKKKEKLSKKNMYQRKKKKTRVFILPNRKNCKRGRSKKKIFLE